MQSPAHSVVAMDVPTEEHGGAAAQDVYPRPLLLHQRRPPSGEPTPPRPPRLGHYSPRSRCSSPNSAPENCSALGFLSELGYIYTQTHGVHGDPWS